jgi:hypothetical protein
MFSDATPGAQLTTSSKNGVDIADIYVGSPDEILFRCHRQKLCEVVPVFSKLLANSSTIHLPEISCEDFDLLMEYVESGGTSIRSMCEGSWDPISFFSLAEKFELPSLQKRIMAKTVRYHRHIGQFASPQFAQRAYQEASEGSMMSKYAGRSVRYLFQGHSDKDASQYVQQNEDSNIGQIKHAPVDLPNKVVFGPSSPGMLSLLWGKEFSALVSDTAEMVFEVLLFEPQNDEGLHVKDIAQKSGMLLNDVFKAGNVLLSEGLIYTTVDDETWAILDY